MTWKQLLAARKVHTHQTNKQELDDLRAVIGRDLSDAAIPVPSEDRRFATAYALVAFFDLSRRKRNIIDYTGVQIAPSTEEAEVLQRAQEFSDMVEAWIKARHPRLI